MKKRWISSIKFYSFIHLIIFVTGCLKTPSPIIPTINSTNPDQKAVPVITDLPTGLILPSTQPVLPINTLTTTITPQIPAIQITSTKTRYPTLTPYPLITLPTDTPTKTLLPTIQPYLAQKTLVALLKTNGNCSLPCWWGITPGVTSWDTASAFLVPIASSVDSDYYGINKVYFVIFDFLPSSSTNIINKQHKEIDFTVYKELVQEIQTTESTTISAILQENGKPDQIWINGVSSDTISPNASFRIALYYRKGFLTIFGGSTYKSDPIRICPGRSANHWDELYIWAPSVYKSFKAVADEYLRGSLFRELAIATNIDLDTFYESYKNTKNLDVCFQMPDPDLHP